MLYTIFVLLTGVYIGQEYSIVPSVKIVAVYCLNYLNSLKENADNNLQRNIDVDDDNGNTYRWLLRKFKLL